MSDMSFNRTLAEPSPSDLTWALMAYLGMFVLSVVAPAIVFMGRQHSPFVRRHAVQALNLGLSVLAVWAVGLLLWLAAGFLILLPIGYTVAATIFLIRAATAANKMDFYQVPVVLAWRMVK
jgi:uncharacterized Tic20 family protein